MAHDFIMDLPSGYSTHFSVEVSRQRVAIARCSKLLVMDEATSDDYEMERICDNLLETTAPSSSSPPSVSRPSVIDRDAAPACCCC